MLNLMIGNFIDLTDDPSLGPKTACVQVVQVKSGILVLHPWCSGGPCYSIMVLFLCHRVKNQIILLVCM